MSVPYSLNRFLGDNLLQIRHVLDKHVASVEPAAEHYVINTMRDQLAEAIRKRHVTKTETDYTTVYSMELAVLTLDELSKLVHDMARSYYMYRGVDYGHSS